MIESPIILTFQRRASLATGGIVLLCSQVCCGAVRSDPFSPTNIFSPASPPAHAIANLAYFVLLITAAIFATVFGLIIYVVAKYRRRPNDDGKEPPQVYGSNAVETAWTVVPIIVVVVLSLVTARVIHQIQEVPKPPGAVDVQIIGHQFWWEIRYPKYGVVTANEIHVPVGSAAEPRPTFLELRSADVAHSFWVPRLAGKTNLIPNRVNTMWIEPERAGVYLGQCAEYCGTQHALMLIRVYADDPDAFDRWIKGQQQYAEPNAIGAAGRELFQANACINCHTVNGIGGAGRFGPDLTHLMSRATLGSGATENTQENLRAWIMQPDHFKPGVLMPAMNLSDSDLDNVVRYLLTLK